MGRTSVYLIVLLFFGALLAGCMAGSSEEPEVVPAMPEGQHTAVTGAAPTEEPIAGGEPPEPSFDPALVNNLVSQAVDQLAEGQIAFDPPREMEIGQSETLHVRIIQQRGESAEALITEGLAEENREVETQPVTVSTEMEVVLEASEDEFKITPIGPARRVVGQRDYTEWAWLVTPQQGGPHNLYLTVSAIVEIPGLAQKTVTLPVLERTIEVRVGLGHRLSSFVGNYWEFLLTVMILPALGGAWRWYKQRQR